MPSDTRERELKKLSDQELIDAFFEAYYAWLEEGHLMRSPDVPDEMRDGVGIDEEGWVPWKTIPSEVRPIDLDALEGDLPGKYPPVFRIYLAGPCTLDLRMPGETPVKLPALPSDGPLVEAREMAFEFAVNHDITKSDLIPFGMDEEEPDCAWAFDLKRRKKDGDCPVVRVHNEGLKIDRTLFPSARAMFIYFIETLEAEIKSGHEDDE